jgi:hypothetical protein
MHFVLIHYVVQNFKIPLIYIYMQLCRVARIVWRYQGGNRNSKDRHHNGQAKKDKQRYVKHALKTKDRVTRIPHKTRGDLRCSGSVSSSCSLNGTRRVNLVTNSAISHEWGNDRKVFATSGTYPWSYEPHIFHSSQLSHVVDRKAFEVMTLASVS